MPKSGIIAFSYSFNKQGEAKKLEESQVAKEAMAPDLCWVHLNQASKNSANWLRAEVNYLDNLAIEALLADETRPRTVEMEHGLLVILRGVGQSKSRNKEMVSIRLWIDSERIISIQKRPMAAVYELQQQIENNEIKIRNSGEFLHHLINLSSSDISDLIYALGEKIDEVEESILKTRDLKFRQEILNARSVLTIYRRYLAPQKEAISKLRSCKYQWIDAFSSRYFQENFDNLSRVIDEIDEVLLRAKILHDELSHALSEKIGHNTFKLSLVTMIFMPLTFITGVFGMNFRYIPGLDSEFGFYFSVLLMILIVAIQMVFLRKKDWF